MSAKKETVKAFLNAVYPESGIAEPYREVLQLSEPSMENEEAVLQDATKRIEWLEKESKGYREIWKKKSVKYSEALQEIEYLRKALEFYADPETYLAIGFFPDPPCGDFWDDFSETDIGSRPGKRAREVLAPKKG